MCTYSNTSHATNTLQANLRAYLENHGAETVIQDNGIAFFICLIKTPGGYMAEWQYIETYNQARQALGYQSAA